MASFAGSQSLSRPRASEVNKFEQENRSTVTLSGLNKPIPVVYGECRLQGLYLVRPIVSSGDLVFAIAWSEGPCEGVQDIYINDEDVPVGVTMTHYDGDSGQGVDPTLASAIPGFADTYDNICYTVFSIAPTSGVTGFPRIEAVLRGIKPVIDGVRQWTQNPGHCMRDFIENDRYGPGIRCVGWEQVRDRGDSFVDGEKRIEFNFAITTQQELPAILDAMSAYAECLWSNDADTVLLVADAPPAAEPVFGTGGAITYAAPWATHDFGEIGGTFTAPEIAVQIQVIAVDDDDNEFLLHTIDLDPFEQYVIRPEILNTVVTIDEAVVIL